MQVVFATSEPFDTGADPFKDDRGRGEGKTCSFNTDRLRSWRAVVEGVWRYRHLAYRWCLHALAVNHILGPAMVRQPRFKGALRRGKTERAYAFADLGRAIVQPVANHRAHNLAPAAITAASRSMDRRL
jgi:hypothetical protein